MTNVPWLTVLWLLPLGGAAAAAGFRNRPNTARAVALVASLAVLAVAISLAVRFEPGGARYQFVEAHEWIPAFGAGYTLGLDGIALALVLLTAALLPLLLLAGWHDGGNRYVALMLVVESMVLMSFEALDVLLFYIFFEAMLIPMYFLIGGFGEKYGNNGKAVSSGRYAGSAPAVKFLLYNLFGGLIMLAAVIGLYVVTTRHGAGTFDLRAITGIVSGDGLDADPQVLKALFAGFLFAFAVKAPLWPLHTWLPDAAVSTTPAGAVLMMAVMDKVGTFGMLRYCLQLFPDAARTFAPLVITLAVIGIIYGALVAIAQTDMMRLIAYTSISHFGFIILGIFAMTSQAQSGSTLYMVNHGLSTAALMLVAGFLVSRTRSRAIADHGGVQQSAPVLAGMFLVAGLATLSLPGLAPFISEFLVLVGTFTRYRWAAVVAAGALVLAAVYVLWLYQRVMGGPARGKSERIPDLRPREWAVAGALVAALIVLGVYPKPVLDVINPAVAHTLTGIRQADPVPSVAGGEHR